MPTHPTTRNAVLQCIEEFGPIAARQIADTLKLKRHIIGRPLSWLYRNGLIYIAQWELLNDGRREMYVPSYQAGPGIDAARPPRDQKRYARKYRAKFRALRNSIR